MTEPRIDAHRAAWATDEAARHVVMPFRRTCRLLVAGGLAGRASRTRLLELLTEYRAGVFGLAATLAALRDECSVDASDAPQFDGDGDVQAELQRIQAAQEKAERDGGDV
jgi:hypothetical protein